MKHFGALPHVTVARNEATRELANLTELPKEEYIAAWSQFESNFWEFKFSIFGKPQKGFCYAGDWGYTLNFETGALSQCYFCVGKPIGNLYDDPTAPLPKRSIGRCPEPHCHNGHALMSLGYIPNVYPDALYGDIRDRIRPDGSHWLQPEIIGFFNTKLQQSNQQLSTLAKTEIRMKSLPGHIKRTAINVLADVLPKSTFQAIKKAYHKIHGK